MGFEALDLKPRIGSDVKADPQALASGSFAKELRALLVERGVLVFRDLDITLDQQCDITATLGHLRIGAEGKSLQKVTRDKKESPEYAAFFPTTFFWHMDGHYGQKIPAFGATLRPARLPPEGGQTEFLNTYAAYDDLSKKDKSLVDRLRVVHSHQAAMLAAMPDAGHDEAANWWGMPPATQPLVWEHVSGRKSLILGGSASHIEGMHPADSYDFLGWLRNHTTQTQYIYTHEWRMNDFVVWNNTGTMHRARPFDPGSDRLLNRFTLDGEEPIHGPPVAR
jgi:alpha-ketoglutarate-dependent taurine dioxygenase